MPKDSPQRISDNPLPLQPPAGISSADLQAGAATFQSLRGGSDANPAVAALASAESILWSDSERMQSVDLNSAEAKKLFPNSNEKDYFSPGDAAYRYLMNKECVDDYSDTAQKDASIVEKTSPGALKTLDSFIEEQRKKGPIPGSHCEVPTS
jgi:hypothetical protein